MMLTEMIRSTIQAITAANDYEKALKKANVGIGAVKEKKEELYLLLGKLTYEQAENIKETAAC